MKRFLLILLIILVAFALRAYRLDFFSLRGDESFTVLFVQKPFTQMWNEIRSVEPNPPLMYLLLRAWTAGAGTGEFATRYFSLFWGVLCVPLIYRLALTVLRPPETDSNSVRGFGDAMTVPPSSHLQPSFSPRPLGERGQAVRARTLTMGLIAAFLIAINPYQIWHSQDVRNYTMWPALSMLALIFFWPWIHANRGAARTSSLLTLGAFVIAELAALYTHYYEAFILVALNLYALFYFMRRRAWFRESPSLAAWAAAQSTLALLYLPFPLLISNRVASYGEGSGQQGVALWDIWQRTFSSFILGETLDENLRRFAWIALALGLALVVIARWRQERRGLFFFLYAGVPTVAVFLLSLNRPLFLERYLNGIAPAYYLLFAWGIGGLLSSANPLWYKRAVSSAALAAFALLALVALANYSYDPAYAKSPDWRSLAHTIDSQHLDGDVILQNFPETSLVYYDRSGLPLVVYPETYLADARTASALTKMNAKFRRVWFIPSSDQYWDPGQYVESWLDSHDDLLAEVRVETFRLELYATRPSNSP